MFERFRVEKGADPAALLHSSDVEASPEIQALETAFQGMLPNHFGPQRTYISPMEGVESTIRSDCSNGGCGTRAIIHIRRNRVNGWGFIDSKPTYGRSQNASCDACKKIFNK